MVETGALKQRARKKLAGNWLTPIAVMLFVTVVGLAADIVTSIVSDIVLMPHIERFLVYFQEMLEDIAAEIDPSDATYLAFRAELGSIQLFTPLIEMISLAGVIFEWVFMLPAIVFFLHIVEGEPSKFGDFRSGWKRCGESLGLYFLITLKVFLWSLLFVIPGIVKMFSYMLAPIIKAKNPSKSSKACIAESCRLMNGHKGNGFILYLSFIGWGILAALATFGAGSIPVIGDYLGSVVSYLLTAILSVYIYMTVIEFYNEVVHPSRYIVNGNAVQSPQQNIEPPFEELKTDGGHGQNVDPFADRGPVETSASVEASAPSEPEFARPAEVERSEESGTHYAGQQQKEKDDDR